MKTTKKMTAKVSKMEYGGKVKKMQSGGMVEKPMPKSSKKMMNGGYGKKKMK